MRSLENHTYAVMLKPISIVNSSRDLETINIPKGAIGRIVGSLEYKKLNLAAYQLKFPNVRASALVEVEHLELIKLTELN